VKEVDNEMASSPRLTEHTLHNAAYLTQSIAIAQPAPALRSTSHPHADQNSNGNYQRLRELMTPPNNSNAAADDHLASSDKDNNHFPRRTKSNPSSCHGSTPAARTGIDDGKGNSNGNNNGNSNGNNNGSYEAKQGDSGKKSVGGNTGVFGSHSRSNSSHGGNNDGQRHNHQLAPHTPAIERMNHAIVDIFSSGRPGRKIKDPVAAAKSPPREKVKERGRLRASLDNFFENSSSSMRSEPSSVRGPTFLEEIEDRQALLARRASMNGIEGTRMRFLVVNAVASERKSIVQLLLSEGQHVFSAADGTDCLIAYKDSINGATNTTIDVSNDSSKNVNVNDSSIHQDNDKMGNSNGTSNTGSNEGSNKSSTTIKNEMSPTTTTAAAVLSLASSPLEDAANSSQLASRKEGFDVIIIDHDIPFISCAKLIVKLRTEGYTGAIFATVDDTGSEVLRLSLLSHGANVVLNKPLDVECMKMELSYLRESMMDG
jgi:CheY-like chemotaxis protein